MSQIKMVARFFNILSEGVKIGPWSEGKNTDRVCLRTEYWGEYLDLRMLKGQEAGGNCITRSFMICTHR
jgi:hypothetical protein